MSAIGLTSSLLTSNLQFYPLRKERAPKMCACPTVLRGEGITGFSGAAGANRLGEKPFQKSRPQRRAHIYRDACKRTARCRERARSKEPKRF